MIQTPMIPGYGCDDSAVDRGGGANLVPGVWKPPDRVTAEEAAAARLWMQAYDTDDRTVSPRDLQRWLGTFLGNLAKESGKTGEEIDTKIKMLGVAVDDRLSKHFTKESLKLAWEKFTFIPSAHELMVFFDELESRERTEAQRLMAVLDAAVKPPPQKLPGVDVDESMRRFRERQDRERRELAAAIGMEVQPLPERYPLETEHDYCIRLAEEAKRRCDEGGRALKRSYVHKISQKSGQLEKARKAMAAEGREPVQKPAMDAPDAPARPDPPEPEGERLGAMVPDPTTADEP